MKRISHAYDRALTGLEKLLSALLVAVLVVIVSVVFAAVVMRYAFNAPLIFSFDLSTLLFAWLVFAGLTVADRDHALMGLDLVPFAPSLTLRRILSAVRVLLCLALTLWLTWVGWKLYQRSGAQIPSLRISARWLYMSLPVGFGLLSLSYFGRLLRLAAGETR